MKQDGRRVTRFEKQVQEIVAQYFIRGFKVPINALITVSRVIMPADLRSAKVYLSIFGEDLDKSKVLEDVQSKAYEFQSHLGGEMKSRYCPKLTFYLDESTEKVLQVEKILEDLPANKKS